MIDPSDPRIGMLWLLLQTPRKDGNLIKICGLGKYKLKDITKALSLYDKHMEGVFSKGSVPGDFKGGMQRLLDKSKK